MKKRWISTIAGVAAISLIAGCGGNADNGNASGSTSGDSGAPKGPVTLKFHAFGSEAQQNWTKVISSFEAKYPDIKVELINLSEKGDTQEYAKKLDLAAASGEAMDVMMFSEAGMYAQRVALGMVAPLDEFINKEGYKVTEEYKVDTQLNGKYYALPGKFNPWYVMLNKDHLKEAGLEVPKEWTWDQFTEYAKKLTKGEGASKRYGTYFHGPQGGGWLEFTRLALANQPDNSDYLKTDGTSNLDNPLFRKSIELRYQMEKVDKSSTPYTDMISQKLHYRPQFFNQSASMVVIGSWMNSELGGTEQFPLNFNVAVAPFPKNAASDQGGYSMVTTDFMAVAASSKNKEAAYKFIRYFTTDGSIAQGKYVPSWTKVKNEDLSAIIDTILAGTKSPDKVDKESLITVLQNARASKLVPPTSYQADVYKVINEEYEKLILDKQNLDAMIKNTQDRAQKLIDSSKK
ncbi:multiple sugar transport system substrate-binding protein [Paenibacillus sp. UNCCL117]|uniref:ABC transporter substrate-binding protein n=1 Tax=unclassified Paenibacillus TaxID=185978 RepID=UPI0008904718|nr:MULTISPECIES: sugar ABC transporter substrate-binding protein [unclassified Paenibacillus]SDC63824.1 multiple sugar transport system substrate-binding protein [Paenibacillus sp. cl123]SFW22390.1 multiple sugar transport system substrate-binding protein [Paenibacillus sp. UNCCL117]